MSGSLKLLLHNNCLFQSEESESRRSSIVEKKTVEKVHIYNITFCTIICRSLYDWFYIIYFIVIFIAY